MMNICACKDNTNPAEAIFIHSSQPYQCYMLKDNLIIYVSYVAIAS